MKLGSETISLSNYLMSGTNGAPAPEIGMGCTILCWSDRKPATIVGLKYFKSGAKKGQISAVLIQEDEAKRIDKNGMSECQVYEFSPNPGASIMEYKVNKSGAFKGPMGQLRIGEKDCYYDFSF